ncbi:hypothetical protein T01_3741 [Trichinella spiralis]|uniref:Uncharacterized protein n=1 Tax=Trichinella spiralis TaxID=6334 RepID=A0A0V1AK77_TRISP|nr:hypothetical protein T01_3741 [Trichinella spiralis]
MTFAVFMKNPGMGWSHSFPLFIYWLLTALSY